MCLSQSADPLTGAESLLMVGRVEHADFVDVACKEIRSSIRTDYQFPRRAVKTDRRGIERRDAIFVEGDTTTPSVTATCCH